MTTSTRGSGVAPMSPRTVGTYLLSERLGEGGMGEVYRAVDTMLEREVALKMLRPELSERDEIVERFRIEAIALARLHHRHIAAVYAFFQDAGRYHIAMQYVRGQTLEAALQARGRLPWREAAAVAMDVLLALEHAHALGVVHRDLKPANLMIDHEGRTVVMDFGIARVLARSRQTRAGTLVGTLEYIAPEVVRGEDVDARSDLYSLGCVLYEMVTGALPFEATSDFALMRAHAEQVPPRPGVRAGEVPEALQAIILRAMEKQPQRRFANASEFIVALVAATDAAVQPVARPVVRPVARWPLALPRPLTIWGPQAAYAMRQAMDWLALPNRNDGAAWRRWLRRNPGLTGAAAVTVGAAVLGLAMAAQQVCCGAPLPLRAGVPQGLVAPAVAGPAVPPPAPQVAVASPALEPMGASPPVSQPVSPPPREIQAVPVPAPRPAPAEAREPPPVERSLRAATPAPAPRRAAVPAPTPRESPAPSQGWYVNR